MLYLAVLKQQIRTLIIRYFQGKTILMQRTRAKTKGKKKQENKIFDEKRKKKKKRIRKRSKLWKQRYINLPWKQNQI